MAYNIADLIGALLIASAEAWVCVVIYQNYDAWNEFGAVVPKASESQHKAISGMMPFLMMICAVQGIALMLLVYPYVAISLAIISMDPPAFVFVWWFGGTFVAVYSMIMSADF